MNRAGRWRTARIAAVSLATATTCLLTAGSANAATPYQFTLCSDGYYSSYATFPTRSLATKLVAPGTCTTLTFSTPGSDPVEIYMSDGRVLGGFSFDRSAGAGVSTTGTASSPGYYRW
ncbi:hypothetical protein [Streptomyces sp. MBT53]|uniref:hypothetical protein n=1 Tax=Streptomyces sp. MBT53 TaxID=1488384 RepID=UPI00191282C2|nr:hypothetical protein [Streptomyces sp. MBT53]MBK6014480.1 hypothetical protein [Streptomyces sp. MBT53]